MTYQKPTIETYGTVAGLTENNWDDGYGGGGYGGGSGWWWWR